MPHDIRPAVSADVPAILELIRGLADYEKLSDQAVATEAQLTSALFPETGGSFRCRIGDSRGNRNNGCCRKDENAAPTRECDDGGRGFGKINER